MACTIYTPIYGSLGPRVNWYMDPTFFDDVAKEHEMGYVRLYGSLPKLLRPKGRFPFDGSLGPVLFIHLFVGP